LARERGLVSYAGGLFSVRAGRGLATVGTILLACAVWLLTPRENEAALPTRPALHCIVVDASLSTRRPRPNWALWVRRQVLQLCDESERDGMDVMVVEFADAPIVTLGPASAKVLSARLRGRTQDFVASGDAYHPGQACSAMQNSSDLDSTLRLVLDEVTAEGRAPGRVALLVDDQATGSDPRFMIERLARAGVLLERRDLPPPEVGDLMLERLVVPARVPDGSPITVHTELGWRGPGFGVGRVELEFSWDDGRNAKLHRQLVPWPNLRRHAGSQITRWSLRTRLDPIPAGAYRMSARVRIVDPDPNRKPEDWERDGQDALPEDDALEARFRVEGSILCGLIGPHAARRELRESIKRTPEAFAGIEWEFLEPVELAGRLRDLDCVLTLDTRTSSLPAAPMRDFVTRGGAWIACAGWSFLNDWFPQSRLAGEDLQQLLPLEPNPDDAKDRDVILLVDGSGSMAGPPFESVRQAAMELSLGALPRDHIQLRFFRGGLGPVIFESQGAGLDERRKALEPLLRASVPGGRTDILYSLEQLARLRAEGWETKVNRRDALAILISDGRTDWMPHRSIRARSALVDAHTRLSVIGIGQNIGYDFLRSLLLEGEELLKVEAYSSMTDQLNQSVNADRVRREAGTVALLAQPNELAVGGLGRAWVESLAAGLEGETSLGLVEILARARALPEAEVLWKTSQGDPLLALRSEGLGRVACLASGACGDWGASFLRARVGLLPGLVRTLAQPQRATSELSIEMHSHAVVLDGAPDDWPPLVRADFFQCLPAIFGARSETRRLLASTHLGLPVRGVVAADGGRRVGAMPSAGLALDGELQGLAEVRVVVRAGPSASDRPLAELIAIAPRPPEFGEATHPVLMPESRPAAPDRHTLYEEASAWGVLCLVMGLLALFASGLTRASQAIRNKSRH
jgi:hypothetical protein